MPNDNDSLEDRVGKLEKKEEKHDKRFDAVEEEVSGLHRIIDSILDRLRSAGGHLGRAGKKGDDEQKKP
jgi:DNA anti-recombination protein RmuC